MILDRVAEPLVIIGAAGVIIPLDNEQPSVFVKRHRDRSSNQWFGGDQFEAKTRLDAEGSWHIHCGGRRDAIRSTIYSGSWHAANAAMKKTYEGRHHSS